MCAAQAARDCATAEGNLDLSKNGYAKIFELGINSPEVLFAVEFKSSVIDHAYDAYVRPSGDTKELGKQVYSGFVPTSELVDSYEMAGDGGNFSWEKHGKDPYANREPRFYATILYNGADWMGRKIESFVGGKDGYKAYENAGSRRNDRNGLLPAQIPHRRRQDVGHERLGTGLDRTALCRGPPEQG